MLLAPITISCPQCGSSDVIYSCKPECCFNHVCNHCYTTFELETRRVGEVTEELSIPADSDPTGPTAPCARCGEPTVFAICAEPSRGLGSAAVKTLGAESAPPAHYVCAACKALLVLSLTEVAPG